MELGCSVISPLAPHEHTHTVVFLHGRGDTSRNMADALLSRWTRDSRGRSLVDAFPSVRWVFPEAEPRLAESIGEIWPQWFDVANMLDPSDDEDQQVFGLRASVASVRRIVRREARAVGGMHRVILAGVSQGGATAVHALLHLGEMKEEKYDGYECDYGSCDIDVDVDAKMALQEQQQQQPSPPPPPSKDQDPDGEAAPTRLCGLMGFSCWLPFPGGSLEETREVLGLEGGTPKTADVVRNTPVFLGHCADDPLVFVEFGRQLRDGLRGFGMDVSWNEYPDGGHWINTPHGMDDAVEFLRAQGVPLVDDEEWEKQKERK